MELAVQRDVELPAEQVFEFFADPTNNPLWQEGMVSCEWTSDSPTGVGSTYSQIARFMGRDVESTFEVTAFEPGRRIAIKTVKSTFPIEVDRRVEPKDENSCQVSASISGGPSGILATVFGRGMETAARKSIERDYDRLVEWLEQSDA